MHLIAAASNTSGSSIQIWARICEEDQEVSAVESTARSEVAQSLGSDSEVGPERIRGNRGTSTSHMKNEVDEYPESSDEEPEGEEDVTRRSMMRKMAVIFAQTMSGTQGELRPTRFTSMDDTAFSAQLSLLL